MQPRVLFLRRLLIPFALSVTLFLALFSLSELLVYVYERRTFPPVPLLLNAGFWSVLYGWQLIIRRRRIRRVYALGMVGLLILGYLVLSLGTHLIVR